MEKSARYASPIGIFSGSTMKIIACVLMLVDHVGLMFFSTVGIYRIIGRLAFPLFAFFIAEGSHYTKHKLKRFLLIFGMGLAYLGVYWFLTDMIYASVFLTFTFSIILIELCDRVKKSLFGDRNYILTSLYSVLLAASAVGIYFLFKTVDFDYGFFGMLLPVLTNLFDFKSLDVPPVLKKLDSYLGRFLSFSLGVLLMVLLNDARPFEILGAMVDVKYFALLAIPLLLLYNGKPGNKKLKYFFYVFYPTHLVVLEIISVIIMIFN